MAKTSALRTAFAQVPLGFRGSVLQAVSDLCSSLTKVRGVASVEIGFDPGGTMPRAPRSPRTYSGFPEIGVVHLLTVVASNNSSSTEDSETFLAISRAEAILEDRFPDGIPVKAHTATKDRFPGSTTGEMFDVLVPSGTKHLLSLPGAS